MPMPKPNPNEEKDDFIKRFMGDPVMVKEYPDAAQRRAIAEKQWERKERAYDEFAEVPRTYKWTIEGAKKWLADNNYSSGNMRTTENFYRFRQTDPGKYSRFENLVIGESRPVMLVRGVLPGGKYETQSVVFYHGKGEAAADEFTDKPQLFRVKNVPIFEAGVWKGGKLNYPVELVQKIVDSANELKDRLKPYIYLGHTGAKQSGQPAVGVLENIRLQGKQILADLADIPKQVFEMLQNKMYRRWSVEIAKDWKDTVTGKTHSRLLTGLALLGAEHPAVNTLPDTIDGYTSLYYSDDLEFDYCEVEASEQEAIELDVHIIPRGGDNMDHEKEMQKLRDDLVEARAKLQAAEDANVANCKESQGRVEAAEAKLEELKAELADRDKSEVKRKIDDFTATWKEKGKILPAQEDLYREKLERSENLDEAMKEMGAMLEGMPNLVELDDILSKEKVDDQPPDIQKERMKDEFVSDMKNTGNREPEDNELVDEFAAVFSTKPAGERAENLHKSREALEREVSEYI